MSIFVKSFHILLEHFYESFSGRVNSGKYLLDKLCIFCGEITCDKLVGWNWWDKTGNWQENVVRIPCLLCGKSYQTQRWLVSQLPTANLSLASMPQPGMIPRQQCPECSWTGATAAAVKTHKTKKHCTLWPFALFCSVLFLHPTQLLIYLLHFSDHTKNKVFSPVWVIKTYWELRKNSSAENKVF